MRYINPCDSHEILNKKYVATYNISVKTHQKDEEIYGTVTVPYTQKIIKVNSIFNYLVYFKIFESKRKLFELG